MVESVETVGRPVTIDAVVETDTRDEQIGVYPMSAPCAAAPSISAVNALIPKQRTAFALKAPMFRAANHCRPMGYNRIANLAEGPSQPSNAK
jgi:hypothetical protein